MNPRLPGDFYPWLARVFTHPRWPCIRVSGDSPQGIHLRFQAEPQIDLFLDARRYIAHPPHAETHEWLFPAPGSGPIPVELRRNMARRLGEILSRAGELPLLFHWEGLARAEASVQKKEKPVSSSPNERPENYFPPLRFWAPHSRSSECASLVRYLRYLKGEATALMVGAPECMDLYSFTAHEQETPRFVPWVGRTSLLDPPRILSVLIDRKTAIHGAEARIETAIKNHAGPKERLFVMASCFTKQLGLNPEMQLESCCGCENTAHNQVDPYRESDHPTRFLAELTWKYEPVRNRKGKNRIPSINLFGYGERHARDITELEEAMKTVGLSLNRCILPDFDLEAETRLDAALLNVIRPWRPVKATMSVLLERTGLPVYDGPMPLGPQATRNWLDALWKTVGNKEPLDSAPVSAFADKHAPLLETLRRQASAFRVALVANSLEAAAQLESEERFGFDVLTLFSDLGFGLVLAGASDAYPMRKSLQALAKKRALQHVEFVYKTPKESAEAFLAALPAEFIYSEFAHDPRLIAAGKTAVGPADFELGFAGAERMLLKLLHKAAWSLPKWLASRKFLVKELE